MGEQETKTKEIVERENELKELIEEQRKDQKKESDEDVEHLPMRTFVTGLITGKVTNVSVNSGYTSKQVVLTVRLSTGDAVNVSVEDSNSYSADNELVRLLEWKNISEGKFGELVGEDITLKIDEGNIFPYGKSPEDYRWEVYVPLSLDGVGKTQFRFDNLTRRFGLHRTMELYANSMDLVIAALGTVAAAGLYVCVSLMFVIILLPFSQSFPAVVFSFIAPAFTALYARIAAEGLHRYKEYRNSSDIEP